MSVGSWTLAAYGPAIGASAATALLGRFTRAGRAATALAATLGPLVATYTAALIADTAVPAWHEGWRELPFTFAGSSAVAAGGAALVVVPAAHTDPARRFACAGVVVELAALRRMHQRLGMVGEPYEQGTAGRYLRGGQILAVGGIALAFAGRRNRPTRAISGVALVAASALTRFGLFHAGLQSADDPKYTVVAQRARIDARTASPD
jgi:hypothetical protein